ncbi:MAG: hypothetical protein PUK75_13895 [bacterium]|nr:hypothetical protein [bacterium]MDY4100458.1 hypothetical protein [Lachnospiraceae bacterium]
MGKKERSMFNGEIEIPETVQKKANLAFSQIKNERVANMEQNISNNQDFKKKAKRGKTVRRTCAAVAACAALVVAAGSWHAGQPVEQSEIAAQDGEEHAEKISKLFMLTAKAAETGKRIEMTKGKPVAVITEDADSWVLGGNEDGTWSYCFNLPFQCEGENIDSVSYSINRGAFQVVELEGTSIIASGKETAEPVNSGLIGGSDYEAIPTTINYYTEYTLDYDRQESDATWINMVRDDIKFSDPDLPQSENRSDEDVKKVFDELFGDVMITCTVHFTDGTSETIEIEPGVVITTAMKNGEEYRDVALTFERK